MEGKKAINIFYHHQECYQQYDNWRPNRKILGMYRTMINLKNRYFHKQNIHHTRPLPKLRHKAKRERERVRERETERERERERKRDR